MKKDGIVELKIAENNCIYYFKLGKLLKERKISKNKLCRDTSTDYKVVSRLLKGDLIRIDVYVLARICQYLNCEINDIFELKRNICSKKKTS